MPATTPRQQPFPEADGKGKEKDNGYKPPVFVRCDLSADQKTEMAEWANGNGSDSLLEHICKSTEENYTLSLKAIEHGYQASLTQQKDASVSNPNGGKSLVTRASSPERALWSVYYKHTQLLKKNWSSASQAQELEW